jgi:hypothetical protein
MTIRIFDAPLHDRGRRNLLDAGPATLRDLIRGRLQQEVERYNQALPEIFQGLVQPEESEPILNGFRMKTKRPLDWDMQCRQREPVFGLQLRLEMFDVQVVVGLLVEPRHSSAIASGTRRRLGLPLGHLLNPSSRPSPVAPDSCASSGPSPR